MPTPRLFGSARTCSVGCRTDVVGWNFGKANQTSTKPPPGCQLLSRPYWDLHESTAWGNSPIDAYFTRKFESSDLESSDLLPDRVGQTRD